MTNDTLVLITAEGVFLLTREDKGPIIISGHYLDDEYYLERVHSPKAEPDHRWRGSLRIELLDQKPYLDVIFNGKVTETIIVAKMLLGHRVELSFLIGQGPPM